MKRIALLCAVLCTNLAAAQDPTFMDTAHQPDGGSFYARLYGLMEWGSLRPERRDFTRSRIQLRTQYGLSDRLTLVADTAAAFLNPENRSASEGLADSRLGLKLGLLQFGLDGGGFWQIASQGTVILPGTKRALGRFDNDPGVSVGLLVSGYIDRHALNAGFAWLAADHNTNTAELNLSYLFRLDPAQIRPDTRSAWYAQIELLSTSVEGGEHHLHAVPGILYETRTWAAEAALRLPVAERDRPEKLNVGAVLGLRTLF